MAVNAANATIATTPILPPPTIISLTTTHSTLTPTPSSVVVPTFSSSSTPAAITSSTPPPPSSSSAVVLTSVVVASGTSPIQSTIIETTTLPPAPAPAAASSTTSAASSSTSTDPALLAANNSASSSGLSTGGTIAVGVTVPIIVVTLLVIAGIFFYRRRKQQRDAAELRRKEVEEYGFNPNRDPTLPQGALSSNSDDHSEMREGDGITAAAGGYRGWGNAPIGATRKPSTTMGSSGNGLAVARSDSGSHNHAYPAPSPIASGPPTDGHSGDPLVSPINSRPDSGDSATIGVLGGVGSAPATKARAAPKRGPSNASSAYSGKPQSDVSAESPLPNSTSNPQYYNDAMYHEDGGPPAAHGDLAPPANGLPVIRDVTARRNTRIESPNVVPLQGNAGIAQNF